MILNFKLSTIFLCSIITLTAACASSPGFRPITPMSSDRNFETGVYAGGTVGLTDQGTIAGAWGRASLFKGAEVTANGFSGVGLKNDLSFDHFNLSLQQNFSSIGGGSLGVRWKHAVMKSLNIGVGFNAEYLQHNYVGFAQRFASVTVSFPVSEAVLPGVLWAYVRPSIGLTVPLYKEAKDPFFGFQEMPAGIYWRILPWLAVTAEGAYHIPSASAYVAGGASFSF